MASAKTDLTSLAFDYIFIVDRFLLTGRALKELSAHRFPGAVCEHVTTFARLRRRIHDNNGYKILIIMELMTDAEPLSEGILLLEELINFSQCRVMVCTDLTDSLLLRLIIKYHPAALTLRSDPVSVLQACMLQSYGAGTVPFFMSSAARSCIENETTTEELTPREIQWLIASIDGLDLKSAAVVLGVEYKTIATLSQRALKKMGLYRGTYFLRWLAMIERNTGIQIQKSGR